MNQFARIESVEVLRDLRSALVIFTQKAAVALEEARAEVQRADMWLKQNQGRHWQGQVRLLSEKCSQAKLALESKERYQGISAMGKMSNVDEKKTYALAKHRLEEARQKMANVKRWLPIMEKEVFTYRGMVQGFSNVLEIEMPNACVQIDRMIDSLEKYLQTRSPQEAEVMTDTNTEETRLTRELWSKSDKLPAPKDATVSDYLALRKRTPTQLNRKIVKIGVPPEKWRLGEVVREVSREMVAALEAKRLPAADKDKVVFNQVEQDQTRIYLERIKTNKKGDSGWFIGTVAEVIAEVQALSLGKLLDIRPDLKDILSLPTGFLVVINGEDIEAILDPQDMLVTPK
ncbi:MAG: hypothetical protein GY869_21795 [Planctomycetes bacterium]|nr:hypothetical protein [Planctomycetota bacterium]